MGVLAVAATTLPASSYEEGVRFCTAREFCGPPPQDHSDEPASSSRQTLLDTRPLATTGPRHYRMPLDTGHYRLSGGDLNFGEPSPALHLG